MRSSATISVLVTSRTATDLPGEIEFELGPLELPAPNDSIRADELSGVAAIELFVERARAAHPGFALTDENAEAIATLCSLLDGIPLAIELMAGKARLLTPSQMLKRFATGSDLLSIEGTGGRPVRQRTLRDTIEWSVGLLPVEHRRALVWMGVFNGGATLESIETVFAGVELEELGIDAIAATESLVQQHLVARVDQVGAEPRFRMLESIRAYARESLDTLQEVEVVRQSHSTHYLALLQEADGGISGTGQAAWLNTIDAEYENCHSAMEWACGAQPQLMLGALNGLWTYWTRHGGIFQGLSWFERLARESGGGDPDVQSKLLNILGNMACDLGDLNLAESSFRTCLELAEKLDKPARQAVASIGLGHVCRYRGDYPIAREWYGNALATATALNDTELKAACLDSIGDTFVGEGNFEKALGLHREALAILREFQDPGMLAYSYCRLGDIAFQTHDVAGSRLLVLKAISLFDDAGDQVGKSYAQVLLSRVERAEGQLDLSRDLVLEALATLFNERMTLHFVETVEEILISEDFAGPTSTVVSLLAMCEQIRFGSASVPIPADAKQLARGKENLRVAMNNAEFETAWQSGLRLDFGAGVRLAVNLVDDRRKPAASSEQGTFHNSQQGHSIP